MSPRKPIARFEPAPGGYMSMTLDPGRTLTMLDRSELLDLADAATEAAARATAPTPAARAGHLTRRTSR